MLLGCWLVAIARSPPPAPSPPGAFSLPRSAASTPRWRARGGCLHRVTTTTPAGLRISLICW